MYLLSSNIILYNFCITYTYFYRLTKIEHVQVGLIACLDLRYKVQHVNSYTHSSDLSPLSKSLTFGHRANEEYQKIHPLEFS